MTFIQLAVFNLGFLLIGSYQPSVAEQLPTPKFKFKSSEYKCSIVFPIPFVESMSENEDSKTLKLKAQSSDVTYFFGASRHINPMFDHKEMAAISLQAFTEALNGTEQSREIFKKGAHEGFDAVVYLTESNTWVFYRVILVGQFQYQVVVTQPGAELSKTGKKFIRSFRFRK